MHSRRHLITEALNAISGDHRPHETGWPGVNRGITTSRSSSVLWKELRDREAGNEQLCDLGSEASWSPRPHRHPSSGIRSKEQTSRRSPANDWSQLVVQVRRIKSEPGVMHDVYNPGRRPLSKPAGRVGLGITTSRSSSVSRMELRDQGSSA